MTITVSTPTLDSTAIPAAVTSPKVDRQPLVDAFRAEVVRVMSLPGVGPILTLGEYVGWFIGQEEQYRAAYHVNSIEVGRCVGIHLEDKQVFKVSITQAAFECELYAARKTVREKAAPPAPAVNTCRTIVPASHYSEPWAKFEGFLKAYLFTFRPEPLGTMQGVTYAALA